MKKTPILLIGGLAMNSKELKLISEPLSNNQTQFYFFDNIGIGCGATDSNKVESFSIEDQAKRQWNLLESQLKTIDHPIKIFGISMGGMIAATAASQRPELVSDLILSATSVNTSCAPAIPESLFKKWISAKTREQFLECVNNVFGFTCRQDKPEIVKEYADYRLSNQNNQTSKDFIAQMVSIQKFDGDKVYDRLAQTNIKITLVAGEEDQLFNQKHFNIMKLRLPKADIEMFPKTGHMLHLENLDALISLISKKFNIC